MNTASDGVMDSLVVGQPSISLLMSPKCASIGSPQPGDLSNNVSPTSQPTIPTSAPKASKLNGAADVILDIRNATKFFPVGAGLFRSAKLIKAVNLKVE